MQELPVNISFQLAQKGLDALWIRQRTIASNLANIDTPGYKSRQIEFESLLKQALNQNKSLDSRQLAAINPRMIENRSTSLREDGNNVDAVAENIELARVQIQYDFLSRAVSGQLARLKYVASEGRG